MKKRIVGIIIAMSMLISVMPNIVVNAAEDITISNLSELEEFRDNVNNGNSYEGKTVTLTANIDMSEKYGEGKENWTPIGNSYDKIFEGTFDGCNYTINNLYINIPEYTGADDYGLFGFIDGTLKNLNVNGSVICYNDRVAGIVASVGENGAVINCSFDGTVKGIIFVGGIAALATGYIFDCHCSGTVDGLHMVGGIVCNVDNVLAGKGIVENCTNESTVTGGSMVGGIAGALNIYAKVTKCVNKGEVKGVEMTEYEDAEMVGGIAGVNGNSSIENCYNTGLVLGKKQIGGITGSAMGPDSDYYTNKLAVKNCYNIGNVTSIGEETAEDIGSIIGENTSDNRDIANNYYLDTCISDAQSTATALTLEQFADKNSFANWDFDTIWEMSAELGRPVLRSGNANKHIHKICGDENCTDEHEDIEWIAWESTDTLPTEAGNYYLTKDMDLIEMWCPETAVNLCLNGHIVSCDWYQGSPDSAFTFFELTDTITLTDCSDTEHKFSLGNNGQWVLDENGTKTLKGGTVINPNGYFAIRAFDAPVNMYNINITGSYGGIWADTLNMYNCTLAGNYGTEALRIVNTANIRDCSIFENTGGGVYIGNGTLNIGGKILISDNCTYKGVSSNVFLAYSSSITIGAPLTDGSYIGIYSDCDASEESPLTITGANDTDYSKYFHSDNKNYKIINGENNSIQLIYDKDGRAYPYTVTQITIFNLDTGYPIHYIPKNKEFVIGINVHKNVELDEYAFIICALYDTDGALMGIYPTKMQSSSEIIPYAKQIPAQDRNVGSIKAFVWDSLNGMVPCCESGTVIEYSNLE